MSFTNTMAIYYITISVTIFTKKFTKKFPYVKLQEEKVTDMMMLSP